MAIERIAVMLPVIILVVIFAFVLLLKVVKSFSYRTVSRQEVRELNQNLSQLRNEVAEIKTQLADIIITLHDRV